MALGWARLRIPVFGVGIVLTGIAALYALASRGEIGTPESASAKREAAAILAAAPPVSATPVPRPEGPLADLTRVDVSDLYPKIKQQAAEWSTGAHLISITASPVVGSKVDLSAAGGEIVYQFATGWQATGREQPPKRLALRVTREGIKPGAASGPAPPPIDPGEPNCVSDPAAKAAHASGIPANTAMKLRYEVDPTLKRGVWTAKVAGRTDLDRVIDGKTCAIVVRR